jgi:hypothetical protein
MTTTRLLFAVLLTALTTTGASLAAQDHWTDGEVRHHVRAIVREVLDDVGDVVRDVRHDARDVIRDVTREVHRAVHDLDLGHAGGGSGQRDRDAWQRREAARERARAAREQARNARNRERDARDRERDERAFRQVSPTDDPCARESWGSRGHACEVRDTRLPAPGGPLSVDASPNGGIRVEAWDQADVLVRSVVQTSADTDAEAREMLKEVRVTAAGTSVSADGPIRDDRGRRGRGWSVGFRIWAPRQTALALTAHNGGVSLFGMRGESRFETDNGGVTLSDVGGQVAGRTRNGGLNVRLSGDRWEGPGLDVETTNGGVSLAVPKGYSAALEVATVNGGLTTDIPVAVQGRIDRQIRATLGSGGPLVRVRTTNGGVRITER